MLREDVEFAHEHYQGFVLGISDLKQLGMVRDNNNPGSSSRSTRPYRSFPTILYEMVDDPSTDSMISWSESGKSFIIWNQPEFSNNVLPKYVKLRNDMSIFKTFGFRKVDSERWEYANDDFVRGKPELTAEIQKRFMATVPPEVFVCKNAAKAARDMERIRALAMAMKERALAKNLSNLTL